MNYRALLFACIAIPLGLPPLSAADDTPKTELPVWETTRLTSPESVEELKALQARFKEVYKKSLPTTVGLLLKGDKENPNAGSAGSGVIVSEDGLILTAAHVIGKPREEISFILSNGAKVKGVSLGMNERNDSGMAKITDKPPKDFPGAKDGKWAFAPLGTSLDLKKGQWLVSLGHPGGPKADRPPPIRTGRFVSYDKEGRFQRNDLLCTDATLVGGDSGGPLFDLDGKVVGIHSEIGMTLDENRHVPMEKFTKDWDQMLRGDLVFRDQKERDAAIRVSMGVLFDKNETEAAKIEEVTADGAADKAGLEAGDIIQKFNGNAVKSAEDLRAMLPSYRAGDKVKLEVERNGDTIKLEIKLAAKGRK